MRSFEQAQTGPATTKLRRLNLVYADAAAPKVSHMIQSGGPVQVFPGGPGIRPDYKARATVSDHCANAACKAAVECAKQCAASQKDAEESAECRVACLEACAKAAAACKSCRTAMARCAAACAQSISATAFHSEGGFVKDGTTEGAEPMKVEVRVNGKIVTPKGAPIAGAEVRRVMLRAAQDQAARGQARGEIMHHAVQPMIRSMKAMKIGAADAKSRAAALRKTIEALSKRLNEAEKAEKEAKGEERRREVCEGRTEGQRGLKPTLEVALIRCCAHG